MSTPLRFSNVEVFSKPFDYIVSLEALDLDAGRSLLAWLESGAPWKLVETDFYEQFEFSLWEVRYLYASHFCEKTLSWQP